MVIAVVMAGGKGTRMNSDLEKPLTKVRGKTLIKHVLQALQNSSMIDRIMVATTHNTPKTAIHVKNLGFEVLETPGEGYIGDLSYILSRDDLKDEVILTITSDLPLITGRIIDMVYQTVYCLWVCVWRTDLCIAVQT